MHDEKWQGKIKNAKKAKNSGNPCKNAPEMAPRWHWP
jgi:hypothetical protein